MATKPRIWYPGCVYHITARGNRKENIFKEFKDYVVYMNMLKNSIEFYKENEYKLICYCLMTNHVHLLVKATKAPVSHLMRRLQSMFTLYYNDKYDCVGHLFEGRYRAKIIKDDKNLLEVSKYIHLNPVRANIVKRPEEYEHSSYTIYIGQKEDSIVDKELLGYYLRNNRDIERYKEYVK